MLADDLAEPVADLVTGAVAVAVSVGILAAGTYVSSGAGGTADRDCDPISSTEQMPMP